MNRIGDLAAEEEYGFSDLGIPVGAARIEPPQVTDPGQADLRDFAMGALAQQRAYAPFQGSRGKGSDPWKAFDIKAAKADEPRDVTLLDPATNQFLGELAVPTEPWEFGLAAAGPAGRVAGAAGKVAAATAGMYGSMVNPAEASIYGRLSKAADPKLFDRAERMLKRGVDPAEVKFATGLERGKDGKLRGEFSDEGAYIKSGEGLLGDLLHHPEYFRHYPDAARIEASFARLEPPSPGVKASYFQPQPDYWPHGRIETYKGNQEPLGSTLHELAHNTQTREGFARGANPFTDEVDAVARQRKVEQRQEAQAEYDQLRDMRHDWMTNYASKHNKDIRNMDDYFEIKDKFEKDFPAINDKMDEVFSRAEQPMARSQKDLYQAYYDWAGEVEARNVAARRHMTEEEMRARPMYETQDRPFEQQIVKDPQDVRRAIPVPSFEMDQPSPKMGALLAPEPPALNPSQLRARAKAAALRGKYPQYAEEYPPIGPPELATKLAGGKPGPIVPYETMEEALAKDATPGFFLQKKLTPDVEQFRKDRGLIQEDLDVYGHDPYFDPAKRFDVDPKHYGPFEDTGTAAAPATAKTDAEWFAKYGTPENRARLQAGYEKGKTIEGSVDWYFMGQLEKEYIKELGPKAGRAAFKREFGDMMSATTGGASPYDNFMMAQYANVMAKRGERMPERAYNLPFPIGGRFASGNIAQAQKYIDAGMKGFDPAQNPKRYDFSGAFAGNPQSMTIDEQMYGALRPATTKASVGLPEWYGPATRVAREEALKAGVDPRSFQDITWAGLKALKTEEAGKLFQYEGPMINHINRSIETTHRLTGMPREEIVRRGLIRKEIPMYGLGGVAAMGALADQSRYQQGE